MAVFRCKMCGGDLILTEGLSVAECDSCGRLQTVPSADDERKMTLFSRAERLRAACEFDKAAGIYEAIVADFPEEAEGYWGLVLCKYGIEYVDDPGTGKKIPTCHRSSFDSVMDDADFEQALENADAVARRVYREEAKQIEELRKSIIAVSSNEQPYDIFICYKETDENGDRTLDSVLAQDIYDVLTEKSYRTFFARITLEDKLGQEYEPYIFAALNSAKIMLAVGTDYEYYNAVWVKNEWSRYLKLMIKDKSKYLIPCFKNLDAYDMPKEFAKLQAQDLGKVGAMQDLLRGIEKILPKQKNTNVIQEKVVVGSVGGNNKVVALLERGNMALEDGDWAKADSFFEDVLNNDARNAQAYVGKTLAQERCRTMDALVRKRRDAHQDADSERLFIQEKTAHIAEMTEKCILTGYVSEESIRKLYAFDRSYWSEVSDLQEQYREEEIWWQDHRWLSRAEKFAVGAVAETICNEKKHLFAMLSDRVKKAQEADARSVAKLEAAYDAHVVEADAKAEKLYNDGLARREREYQSWLSCAKTSERVDQLEQAEIFFSSNRAYKDSKNLAEHCRKRIADVTAEMKRREEAHRAAEAAEAERRRIAEEKAAAARKKKNTIIGIISGIAVVAAIALFLVVTQVIIPNGKYNDAVALLDSGSYKEAIAAFEAMDGYKDSTQKIEECKMGICELEYTRAIELIEAGRYADAVYVFERAPVFENGTDRLGEMRYSFAEKLLEHGENARAAIAFGRAIGYQDAWERSSALWDGIVTRKTILAGYDTTMAIREDGTVVAVGDVVADVGAWKDVIDIEDDPMIGLCSDGTVISNLEHKYEKEEECGLCSGTNIVAISGYFGLRADGTVVLHKDSFSDSSIQAQVDGWSETVGICAFGDDLIVGLSASGSVMCAGDSMWGAPSISGWKNIVAVSTSDTHVIGLRSDGTVVSEYFGHSNDYQGECEVSSWRNIVAVSAGDRYTVGLRKDGTVVVVGDERSPWRIKHNQSKDPGYGETLVHEWSAIVAISAAYSHTVGLRSDGTVVVTEYVEGEYNLNFGQHDISGWTGIRLP